MPRLERETEGATMTDNHNHTHRALEPGFEHCALSWCEGRVYNHSGSDEAGEQRWHESSPDEFVSPDCWGNLVQVSHEPVRYIVELNLAEAYEAEELDELASELVRTAGLLMNRAAQLRTLNARA